MPQAPPPQTVPSRPRPLAWPYPLLLAVIIAAGCQADAGSSPDAFAANPWTLSEREVRIGSVDDPDYIFGPIGSLSVGPDGLLYTMHWGEGTIRRWTQDGAPAGSVGREGEGPGEFQEAAGMGFFGDSLWVWDRRAYRVSYFDLEGEFLGSVSPRVEIGTMEESPPRPDIPLRDGTFIGMAPMGADGIARGTLTETPIVRIDADGNRLARIWAIPHEPRDIFAILSDGGFGGSYSGQPFDDSHIPSIGERGVTVLERRAWTGTGEATVRVTKIGLDGDTLFAAAVPYDPVPLPSERYDSAVAVKVDQWRDRPFSASEADIRKAMYRPSHLPAVRGLMQAEDGPIWLRRYDPVESETGEQMNEWWVLDADGAPLARALTPVGLSMRVINGDTVWGVERDELGVEYIVRYRLAKDG